MAPHPTDTLTATGLAWLAAGHRVARATLVSASGSSPNPEGSRMLVRDDGLFAGSVSAGCLEGAVITAARDILAGAPARLLDLDTGAESVWGPATTCGAQLAVYVEPWTGPAAEEAPAAPHLVVVGATHIAQHLASLAAAIGYGLTVVDPRSAFAAAERFPGTPLSGLWPDEFLAANPADAATAVVALAHDPKIDDPALMAALASPAFFIGALGSRRSHAARLGRLEESGLPRARLARIQGPVGLDIGAEGPAEIAVSILAAVIRAWRRP